MPQIPETFETLLFVPYYWSKIKSLILEKLNDYVLKPTTDTTIANGDKLVITDASNSNKIERTSIVFDGSTTTKALTQKGTWETFLQSAPVTSVNGQTGAVNLTIPSAPGTLNTTATTAQSTSSSEALSGNITLHKVAKTGTYSDLIGAKTKLSEFTNDSSYIANNTFYNTITLRSTNTVLNSEDIIIQTGANKIELNPTGLTYRDNKHFLFDDAVITTDIEGGVDAHWSTLNDSQLLSAAVIKAKLEELPAVNNATLTIQKNGTTVGTFTANASSNATANILVNELPTVSSSDNGKILQVVNGAWALVTPTSIYSGTSEPDSNTGNNGDLYLQTS